jgi:hypothetical protein
MMKKHIVFVIIGILVGIGVGALIYDNNKHDESSMDNTMQSSATNSSGQTMHAQLEIDPTKPMPSVSVQAIADSKDGYNLFITTQNFTLTPENVGQAVAPNSGHMHLYVNDAKIARLYGSWYHLSKSNLKDGDNTLEITLNANDHSEWVQNGQHIAAKTTVKK